MTKPRALLSLTTLLVAGVLALGCKKNEPASEPTPPPKPAEPVKAPEPIKAAAEATPPPADSAPPKPAEPEKKLEGKAALLSPKSMTEEAPAKYKVKFTTTKGDFVVEVTREWAPQGADRFYNLVKNGFFEETRFFRVIKGFMVQFGLSGE